MNESVQEVIVCPWCYVLIEVVVIDEVIKCFSCNRIITEEDLDYACSKED